MPSETIRQLALRGDLRALERAIDPTAVLDDAIAIQQIPAPTFYEDARARYVRERFARYPLRDVEIDALANVYGRWLGAHPDRPAILLSAHLDTVFPAETDLTIHREGDRVYGPGIGDNSVAVAGLLAVLDLFHRHHIQPEADVWFVANSREEGLGNLDGIRAVWERLGPRLGGAVVVEGMALGRVYRAGIAVRRLRITAEAPGGHSWLHFGAPSAVHGLIELGGRILQIAPPDAPRTTYNIGMIEGGRSVNSLATSASMCLDLRSERTGALRALEQAVYAAIEATTLPDLRFKVEVVGDRPEGAIPADHPLVRLAEEALRLVGMDAIHERGSTDANVLLANGLPAVTVGVTVGGHAHRTDEYIETAPLREGVWQLLLLVLAAAQQAHTWQ